MPNILQTICTSCDEAFGPDQLGQPCPYCDEPLRDAEEAAQAAWERQQEAWAADPPISAQEQYEAAAEQRRRLRGGY